MSRKTALFFKTDFGTDKSGKINYSSTPPHLTEQEVDLVVDEDLDLFTEFLLYGVLALASQVRGGLAHAAQDKGVTLIGYGPCQITSCLVDGFTLQMSKRCWFNPC